MAKYITFVFESAPRAFKGNPFEMATPFGKPVGVSIGNLMATLDDVEQILLNSNDYSEVVEQALDRLQALED